MEINYWSLIFEFFRNSLTTAPSKEKDANAERRTNEVRHCMGGGRDEVRARQH